MIGIYKITNNINQKSYIGQSIDIERRWQQHKSESFNVKSPQYNTIFYRAIRKYDIKNFSFEIIEECSKEQLNKREQYWIKYYDTFNNGYNMTIGGECGPPPKINSHDFLNAWNKNLSYTELHKKFNCSKTTIQNYLNKCQVSIHERRIRAVAYKSKAVDRYSLMGKFIKTYPSISEAVRELSINYPKCHTSMICAACLKKNYISI